jgi:hypothetical protein
MWRGYDASFAGHTMGEERGALLARRPMHGPTSEAASIRVFGFVPLVAPIISHQIVFA